MTDYGVQVVKVKVTPHFPARVTTDAGLGVDSESGVFTFHFEFATLTPVGDTGDGSTTWIPVWDENLNEYRRVSIATAGEAFAGASPDSGFIISAADPSLPNADVLTSTPTVTVDYSTPGQVKLNAVAVSDPLKANIASPVFTGDPKAPTPTAGDNDTSIATTAFVTSAIAAIPPGATGDVVGPAGATADAPVLFNGTTGKLIKQTTYPAFKTSLALTKADVGLGNVDNTSDANKPVSTATQTALNLKADLASPTFTGDPKAPTPAPGDNDTSIATTAYVTAADALKANIASPTFTGDPKAPTPTAGDNDTSIATTAFVTAAIAAIPGGGPGGINNVVEDLTPQLGGDLDTNAFDIWFDDAKGIRDSAGNEHLIFQEVASAANYWEMENSAAAAAPRLRATGSDAVVNMVLETKGGGLIALWPGGVEGLRVVYVASAVNYVQAYGAAAGGTVGVAANGTGTDVGLFLHSKGVNPVSFGTNGGAQIQAQVIHAPSAVNQVTLRGAGTGGAVAVASAGSDPNPWLQLATKGSGAIQFAPGYVEQMRVNYIASAVNFLDVRGSVAGAGVSIGAAGTDTNIATIIGSKANPVILAPGFIEGMRVSYLVGGNQYVNVMGGIDAGTVPSIQPSGTGTNIDLSIGGKGTGGAIVTHKNVGGLLLKDSDSSHVLAINATSNLTANRTLSIVTGDADRTLDLTGGGGPFQPLDGDLTALAALGSTGISTRTAANTYASRTIVGTAPVTVTSGDGVSGNPTISVDADLVALAALGSTGLAARTAADTWAQRAITATAPLTVTNGDGVAGNPLLAIAATFGGLLNVQAFSADGTFTTTAGARALLVIATGGGGGGGGAATTDNATGAGGGGGATAIGFIASPAASYAVDIGAGGTAGSASNGGTGSPTTFGGAGVLSANGGLGGDGRTTAGATNGGLGGTTTAGSALISGVAGGDGDPGFSAAGGGTAMGGSGGSSLWGGGGRASAGVGGKQNGKAWGSGAGGGVRLGGSNDTGGTGSVGFVLVLEFG